MVAGKAGFVSALASERHQLEGMMTPEEIQMKHRADIYDKVRPPSFLRRSPHHNLISRDLRTCCWFAVQVSHDERAITAVAVGKTQGHKAAEKAKYK